MSSSAIVIRAFAPADLEAVAALMIELQEQDASIEGEQR
jgi:hypothetical protein